MQNIETFVIFETWIDGQLARVEIPADAKVLHSRSARDGYAAAARSAFMALAPGKVRPDHKIKAVDIIQLPALDDSEVSH